MTVDFFGTDFTDFAVLVFWWGSNAGRAEDGGQMTDGRGRRTEVRVVLSL